MPIVRRVLPVLALMACLGTSGCTLCKPVVGAVTGPIVMLGHSNGDFNFGCQGDGRAVLVVLALASAVGAGAGLVTGIISDVHALCGDAHDPCHNWWDPFKTNTSN